MACGLACGALTCRWACTTGYRGAENWPMRDFGRLGGGLIGVLLLLLRARARLEGTVPMVRCGGAVAGHSPALVLLLSTVYRLVYCRAVVIECYYVNCPTLYVLLSHRIGGCVLFKFPWGCVRLCVFLVRSV